MKNILIFMLVCLCMVSCKDEVEEAVVIDPIYKGKYTISSLYANYGSESELEGKTEIHGPLSIHRLKDQDLSFFKSITRIVGDVTLTNNEFTDLSFLSGLESVEGKLTIQDNEDLLSLDGLENLKEVESLEIKYNNRTLIIDAIKEIRVNKMLRLLSMDEPIPVFSNIDTLTTLSLNDLNGITDYSFMVNLSELTKDIWLTKSKNVVSLNGFQNLRKVNDFTLDHLPELIDITAIENLETASAIKSICNNKLTNYCPLKNILSTVPGITFIAKDAPVEPTAEEIIANCP